jgi:hypothetical protein
VLGQRVLKYPMNPLAFSWFDFHLFNVSKVADREPEDDITHYYHTSQLVGDCEMSDSWPRGTWQLTASEYGVLLDELDRLQLLIHVSDRVHPNFNSGKVRYMSHKTVNSE